MKKILQGSGIAIAVIFVGMQFFRSERTNPPVDPSKTLYAVVPVPEEVRTIFERSCFDCHSNETRWPWYSGIAPAMWLVAADVEEGREHLNLSEFADYKPLRAVAKLDMICEQLLNKNMPLPNYLTLHPGAAVSREEANLMCDWVESVRDSLYSLR
ncbi:MAG TPA: heme-binding domain-containing protein [Bacteroidota bacterium]